VVTGVWVDGPAAEPRPFGLFTAAEVVEAADAQWLLHGTEHQVDYCGEAYDSAGICFDFGTVAVTLNSSRLATLHVDGTAPDGTYSIDWGDNDQDHNISTQQMDGLTHQYAADGAKTITITGPRSYGLTTQITVTNGATTGGAAAAAAGIAKQVTSGIEVVHGDPFVVLHLLECIPVGQEDLEARALRALQMGEQRAVERVVSRQMARDPRVVIVDSDPHPPADALGLLEAFSGSAYPGRPTLHATPDTVTALDAAHVLYRETINGVANIATIQGSKVVSGGGYDLRAPSPPDPDTGDLDQLDGNGDGIQWVYVTGAVQVRRATTGEANSVINTTGGVQARNQASYLAERPYVVTWDCLTAAIPVTVRA
jgi:hypothetical protein